MLQEPRVVEAVIVGHVAAGSGQGVLRAASPRQRWLQVPEWWLVFERERGKRLRLQAGRKIGLP